MLYQVRTPHTKCLELGAVHPPFYPLVYGLSGDGRVNALSRLLNAVVITHGIAASPALSTRAANAETRQSIPEVHDCQLYHTLNLCAIGFAQIIAIVPEIIPSTRYEDTPFLVKHHTCRSGTRRTCHRGLPHGAWRQLISAVT